MSKQKPTRAIDYLRVSDTRGRTDTLISFDVQAEKCSELRTRRGWDLVKEIRDPDRKGSTLDRPGLNEARQMLADGKADVIVVWKLNRFARTMVKALLVLQDITDAGGAVVSCDPQEQLMDTSTALGRGIAALLFSVAEDELDKIRSNWRNAAEHAVANGWYMGGYGEGRVLGYVKEKRQPLRPHPEQAPIIAELFQRAATGESYAKLRRWLQGNGIDIAIPSVRRLLQSRVYLGEMHWGSSAGANRGSRPRTHEPISNLNAHEPLIDEITWRRAQRSGHKFGLGREQANPRLLSGLTRCSGCRSTMVVNRMSDRGPYYTCRQAGSHPDHCAGSASIAAPRVEAHVDARMVSYLHEHWSEIQAQDDQGHEQLRALDAEIAVLEEQILEFNHLDVQKALGAGWREGLIERYELADRLQHDRATVLKSMSMPESLSGITEPEDYLTLDIDAKRRALSSVIDLVFVRQTSRRGPGASSDAAIRERTKIIWRPDGDGIILPRPGFKTDWQPFTWS